MTIVQTEPDLFTIVCDKFEVECLHNGLAWTISESVYPVDEEKKLEKVLRPFSQTTTLYGKDE